MSCSNCGGAVNQTADEGGMELGAEFREEYRCVECGLIGSVSGVSGQPTHTWTWTGCVSQ